MRLPVQLTVASETTGKPLATCSLWNNSDYLNALAHQKVRIQLSSPTNFLEKEDVGFRGGLGGQQPLPCAFPFSDTIIGTTTLPEPMFPHGWRSSPEARGSLRHLSQALPRPPSPEVRAEGATGVGCAGAARASPRGITRYSVVFNT